MTKKSRRPPKGLSADDLVKIISTLKGKSIDSTKNVVPEFDPDNKSQDVERWLTKVNECALIYDWGEKQTTHYALQKLNGLAKRWYESLPTLNFTWQEWQCKIKRAFPSDENHGKMLEEMLARKTRTDESLRDYFYDKLSLLSRCEISGKKAVDCLVYGITDNAIRNGAQAMKCTEPEDLLNYLASQQYNCPKTLHSSSTNNTLPTSSNNSTFRRRDPRFTSNRSKLMTVSSNRTSELICFNCHERGHNYNHCSKPIIKCVKCGRVGHNQESCYRRPLQSHEVSNDKNQNMDKKVLKINSDVKLNELDTLLNSTERDVDKNLKPKSLILPTNEKYFKTICVNSSNLKAFIDFGSDCSLIKLSCANTLGLKGNCEQLPIVKGFGNSTVQPVFQTTVVVKVDEIEAEITVLVVDDVYLPAPVLIGQNFTELPSVTLLKDNERLYFYHTPNEGISDAISKINLYVEKDVTINRGGLVSVYTREPYSGDVYFDGSTRTSPNQEYHLHQGCYRINDNKAVIFTSSLTSAPLELKAGTLIARASPIAETKTFAINSGNTLKEYVPIDKSEINVGDGVDEETMTRLYKLLTEYRQCFAQNLSELGCVRNAEMNIELLDKAPVVYRPYRLSHHERLKVRDMVDELLKNDIVQESESNYASPIIIVKKKNGESRLCVDYRALNNKTVKDKYPLPLIEDQISNLSGKKFFITLDLASGYYQVPMGEESRRFTAFITPDGHYEFKRMPFGLANAPAVFQRIMNRLLGSRRFDSAHAYMDDLLIPSATIDEGFEKLEDILKLLQDAGLTLKLEKCRFFDKKIEYLGYEVSSDGIKPGERKTIAVKEFPTPNNTHELRQFLGLASYFRKFVKGFGEVARPLTKLLKKDSQWSWGEEQIKAFATLKTKLIERPILALFDPKLKTELHTDASSLGLGGILMQTQAETGALKPVAYFSRQTTPEERHFHSYELETLAVVCSLKKFRPYLLGLEFTVYTDCNALRTTLTKRDLIPRIARWWLQISEFNFNIEYRPGTRMSHVDALSRNPVLSTKSDNCASTLNITTDNWILTLQNADPELQRIIKILKPDNEEESKEIKKNYVIHNHALHRKVIGEEPKLVIPKSARWQICRANHDDIGHFGVAKTTERIKNQYWFPKMSRFIKKYVAACIECAYNKDNAAGARTGFLFPIEKGNKPFETLHVDHLGPFVRSKANNCYILTIVDAFTKYLFVRPVKDTKTKNVIKVLESLFHDFGTPNRIISDRGTAFTSIQFEDFCRSNGVKHILNAVACPRANGQAERFNQTILASLSTQNFNKDERIWDQQLGKIQWGINNTVNATTKKSASELLFGTKLNGPTDNMLALPTAEVHKQGFDDSIQTRFSSFKKMRQEASVNIKNSQDRQKKTYDSNRLPAVSYAVGDLVKITKTNFQNDGKSKKLLPKFIGPFKVTKYLGNDRYEISNVPGFKARKYETVIAADRMRPWIHVQTLDLDKSSSESSDSEL